MRTILLTLAYDGSGYCGWQVQPNGVSVQAVVERALAEFAGEPIRATAAGRTDAGVHAVGQLVSFDTAGEIPVIGFRLGLQTKLPEDVVVRNAQEVPYGFSARYDTVRKTYRYIIQNSPWRTPWLRKYVGWHRSPLDERAMQEALDVLVGTHDFRSFETEWPNKSSSVRTIASATIWRAEAWNVWADVMMTNQGPGNKDQGRRADNGPQTIIPPQSPAPPFLCIDVTADGFLYNMVRAIVGTLIHVGRGNWTADDVRRILEARNRAAAGETAPPEGLYLLHCDYVVDEARISGRLADRALPARDE
jgi:tRNA pseudouridine38-40 synthase